MQERLKELQQEAIQSIEQSSSLKELNDIRVAYLGKKDQSRKYFVEWVNFQPRSVQ